MEPEPKKDRRLAQPLGDSLAPLPVASSAGEATLRFDFGAIADAAPGFESQIAEVVARAEATTDVAAPVAASEPKETGVVPRADEDAVVRAAPSTRFGTGLWLGLAIGASAAGAMAWWAWPVRETAGGGNPVSSESVPTELRSREPTGPASEREPSRGEPSQVDPAPDPTSSDHDPVARDQTASSNRPDPVDGLTPLAPERPESARGPRPGAREEASEPPATRSVDVLLDEALGGGGPSVRSPSPPPAPPSPDLPESPSRSNVAQTLGRLVGPMRLCAAEKTGVAMATISLESSGRVESVSVSGAPFGGTREGACMESVIRRARFEPFARPSFQVRYPFSIRPQL